LLARDRYTTNFAPLFCCNDGVAVDPCHHAVRLVACATTPQYRSSSGTQDHATAVWVQAGSFDLLVDTQRNKRKIGMRHISFLAIFIQISYRKWRLSFNF
jgi:hypothetical protein